MPALPVLGRILRSADFERVLGAAPCARSTHFAVHFLASKPGRPAAERATAKRQGRAGNPKLSTEDEPCSAQPVDGLPREPQAGGPTAWLGSVVPKRHARRAVTRNLLKRQIRAAWLRRDAPGSLPLRQGLWVVRLRAPIDRTLFASAASPALRQAARCEIEAVLDQAERRLAAGVPAAQGAS